MPPLILGLIIAVLVNVVFFFIANKKKTHRFADLTYASTFILIALAILIFNRITYGKILLFLMIFAWGLRLTLHLSDRKKQDTKKKLSIFFLIQGISAWIIMIPAIIYLSSDQLAFNILTIIGFLVWLAGLIIEAKADEQKYRHKNRIKNKWVATGLWKYSRHPNYFGEILCWIGIYVFFIGSVTGLNAIIGLISPIIIIVLLFVKIIPKIELSYNRRYSAKPEYKKYKKTTSLLIPWFKKG